MEYIKTFIGNIFVILLPFLGTILLVLSIVAILIMIFKHFWYGYNYFSVFSTEVKDDRHIKNIYNSINNLKFNKNIVISNEHYSDLIVITKKCLFLIKIFPYDNGIISYHEDELELKTKNKLITVPNPYKALSINKDFICDMYPNIKIKAYLVFPGNININQNNYKEIIESRPSNIAYKIQKEYNDLNTKIDNDTYQLLLKEMR